MPCLIFKRTLLVPCLFPVLFAKAQLAGAQTPDDFVQRAKKVQSASPDSAIFYYNQAAEMLLASEESRQAAWLLYECGMIYSNLGNMPASIEAFGRAHELTSASKDSLHHAVKIDLAFSHFVAASFDTALVLLNQAVQYFEGKDTKAHAYALNTRGNVLNQSGLFNDALLDYHTAFEQFMAVKDSNKASKVCNSMGHISATMGDLEGAMEFYEKARLYYRGEGREHHEAVVLLNEGSALWRQGRFVEALDVLLRAENIAAGSNDERLLEVVYGEISITYSKLRNFEKGLEYNARGMELARKNEYTVSIARYGVNLGYIYLDMAQPHKALVPCMEALAVSTETVNQHLMADNCDCLYQAYKAVGEADSALKYLELTTVWRDSLFNVEKVRSATQREMELKNKLAKQRLEADSERAQLIAVQKLKDNQDLLTFSIVGIVLLMLVLALILRAYRIKQRANTLISKEKDFQENLLQNIVHEFRTPLTLIEGPLVQLSPKFSSKEDIALFEIVQRNSGRLLVLVNQLLDMAKMKAGRLSPGFQETELTSFLQECLGPFEKEASDKGIELKFPVGAPMTCKTDPEFLQKIVSNLLSNAMKFTPAGGSISLAARAVPGGVQISVQDTGIGISPEEQKNIFEKFYQVDAQISRRAEGTGIGLSFASELARALNGTISVKSTLGEGALFTLFLPVEVRHGMLAKEAVRVEVRQGAKPVEWKPEEGANSGKDILLLAEDNKDMQQFITGLMKEAGFEVVIANNGKEGLKAAAELVPDIIISDVMMPEMDGYEFCHRAKEDIRISHIPFILLTAKASQDSRLRGFAHGADHYIGKPFHAGELKLLVKNAIRNRQKLQERYKKEALSETGEDTLLETTEPFLRRLVDDISKNLHDEERNTENLAQSIGISRSQLHRKLKGLTGMSSTQFVHAVKMLHARKLLTEQKCNISEAAYAVGFKDPSYFTKIFTEHFGKTPSSFLQSTLK